MSSLIPTKKDQPCEICGNKSGKCRQHSNKEIHLCMTYADARLGDIQNGFKCVKEGSKGWSTWKIDNSQEWTEDQKREWKLRNEARKLEAQRLRKELAKSALPIPDRDQAIRKLHKHFGLSAQHRENLRSRGLADEIIEKRLFFSVKPDAKVPHGIPANLPGVSAGRLKAANTGIACVAFDNNNKATGWQVRLDNTAENKYRWCSGEKSAHLANGELPISTIKPIGEIKRNSIGICEGFLKPTIAANKLGQLFLGASAANFASSPEQTKQHLEAASELLGTQTIDLYPDAGSFANKHVSRSYRNTLELFYELGYEVNIAWWGQVDKTHPDIDELTDPSAINYLTESELAKLLAQYLPKQEQSSESDDALCRRIRRKVDRTFLKIKHIFKEQPQVQQGFQTKPKLKPKIKPPALNFTCTKAKDPEVEENTRKIQRKLHTLTYGIDIEVSERYLPHSLVDLLPKSGIIGIHAPKGCGKSTLIKKIIKQAKAQGDPVLSIVPRIALGREQAIKWEITWIDNYGQTQNQGVDTVQLVTELEQKLDELEQKLKDLEQESHKLIFINGEESDIEQQKSDLRTEIEDIERKIDNINNCSLDTLGLCWDSLWRIKDRNLSGALIIIDEAELGINHLVTGGTCRRNRPSLIKVFTTKLKECLQNGGRVILADADLTNLPINYIKELSGYNSKPFIVHNSYQGKETQWRGDHHEGNRSATLRLLKEKLAAGEFIAIATDSQKEAEALEKLIIENLPNFCKFVDDDGEITSEAKSGNHQLIVRLDRSIAQSKPAKEFINHINEQILLWQPQVLIYTPTLGVGVSIDESTKRESVPYFDCVFGLFFGIIEPSQCRQMLARFRANVPRIIYTKDNRQQQGSFYPDEINKRIFNKTKTGFDLIEFAKQNLGEVLKDTDDADYVDAAVLDAIAKLRAQWFDEDSETWKEPTIDLYSKLEARRYYGLYNLSNLLAEELTNEDHYVTRIKDSVKKTPGTITDAERLSEIKEENDLEKAAFIAKQPLGMPVEEARKQRNALGNTKELAATIEKVILADELPDVDLTPELIYKARIENNGRWLGKHKLFWYLQNTEAAKTIDKKLFINQLRKAYGNNTSCLYDVRSQTPKIKAIVESGVLDFVDLDKPFDKANPNSDKIYLGDSPEGENFVKQALKHKTLLQSALGVTVTKNSEPIALANRILAKIGLGLQKLGRGGSDLRYILHKDVINDPDRLAVLEAFSVRWQQELDTEKESQNQNTITREITREQWRELKNLLTQNQIAELLISLNLTRGSQLTVLQFNKAKAEFMQEQENQVINKPSVNPFVGAIVRIKALSSERCSLMRGVECVIKAMSNLGRLTVEAFGRIEYFDEDEVEVLGIAT